MGHTATNVIVYFIFSTRRRAPQITPEIERDLHAYLGGITANSAELHSASMAWQITFISSFACLQPIPWRISQAWSRPIRRVGFTSDGRKKELRMQTGYGAFSVSESGQSVVREYILHQQQHHARRSFKEEFVVFLQKNHITIDDKFLWT